jgi:PncC family amidohydrolase
MMPEPFEQQLHRLFIERQWSLLLAESCTGGAIAAKLTAQPGASKYFLGSIVSYSNALKTSLLGVQESTLKEKGAVSEETALEMVEGTLLRYGSDFALAVTGIAGPEGGTASRPVGTVWYALGRKGKQPQVKQLRIEGGRQDVITGAVNAVLEALLSYAQDELRE